MIKYFYYKQILQLYKFNQLNQKFYTKIQIETIWRSI